MRVVMFCHSLLSDWNHGNAHFLRGIASELIRRGHDLRLFEPRNAWSMQNLLADHGEAPLALFHSAYPLLSIVRYDETLDLDESLDGADLAIVHEWTDPALVRDIGRVHQGGVLLFHDTHHRSVTDPRAMFRYDLDRYDGVLAFGASVAEVYRAHGWGRRIWTWHEAADPHIFRPQPAEKEGDLVWIGNHGDDERTAELSEFLIDPVRDLGLKARVHGVRYEPAAIEALRDAGIEFGGWVPNFRAPQIFGRFRFTVHVPRRPYATALPGVPTIRMFEALACGIPLISAPWNDSENLFNAGEDFLFAHDGEQMRSSMRRLLDDPAMAAELADHGRETVLARHTCAHRVDELMDIYDSLAAVPSATSEELTPCEIR